jgi:hypothetical protein
MQEHNNEREREPCPAPCSRMSPEARWEASANTWLAAASGAGVPHRLRGPRRARPHPRSPSQPPGTLLCVLVGVKHCPRQATYRYKRIFHTAQQLVHTHPDKLGSSRPPACAMSQTQDIAQQSTRPGYWYEPRAGINVMSVGSRVGLLSCFLGASASATGQHDRHRNAGVIQAIAAKHA